MRLLWITLAVGTLTGCDVYEPPAARNAAADADPSTVSTGIGSGAGGDSIDTPVAASSTGGGSSVGGSGGAQGGAGGTPQGGAGGTPQGGAGGTPQGGAGGSNAGSVGSDPDAGASGGQPVEAGPALDVQVERAQDVAPVAVGLPFVVDSYFVPTGYMGDGLRAGAITFETSGCKLPRPTGARGNCYRVTYRPQPPTMPGNPAWAGVYWLSPQDNWGQKPGRKIQPGATRVTFYAAGATGMESVAFRAGGVQDPMLPNQDTFRVEQSFMLSTSLTQYSLDLTGQTYDTVIGGFAWIVVTYDAASWAPGAPPIVFYIDDIEWPR